LQTFHPGFYFENCFVLVEGQIDDGIFNVSGIGLPPPESAQNTRFANHDSISCFQETLLDRILVK